MSNIVVVYTVGCIVLVLFSAVCWLGILSLYWFELGSDQFLCQVGIDSVC